MTCLELRYGALGGRVCPANVGLCWADVDRAGRDINGLETYTALVETNVDMSWSPLLNLACLEIKCRVFIVARHAAV